MKVKGDWPPRSREFYSEFTLPLMLNGKMPAELMARIAEVPNEPQKAKRLAVATFAGTLRGLVDQWIDSGKCDGVEYAWKRDVKWKTGKLQPLIEILADYRQRNPPHAKTGEDGRSEVSMLPALPSSPILRARDMAVYCLIGLLDSRIRERILRCDRCSTYFVRARMPRRDMPVKRGTYCAKCKLKGKDRARRTVDSRTGRTKQMTDWAADAWAQWKPDRRDGNREKWVAQMVNDRLPDGW